MAFDGKRTPNKLSKRFLHGYGRLVAAGVPPLHAARTLGVSNSTFYAWLKAADEEGAPKLIEEFADITERKRAEMISIVVAKAHSQIKTTADALNFLKVVAKAEFGDDADRPEDLSLNQMLVGIVRNVADRQNAISAAAESAAKGEGESASAGQSDASSIPAAEFTVLEDPDADKFEF